MEMNNQILNVDEPSTHRRKRPEDREAGNRSNSERPPIVFSRGSRFNLSPTVLADDRYEFSFIEYSVQGEQDNMRCENALANYWELARPSDHPELKRSYKKGLRSRDEDEDIVQTGGQMLFKREKYICEAERQEFAKKNDINNQIINMHRSGSPHSSFLDPRNFSQTRGDRL